MTKLTQNRASSISVPASRVTFAGLASLVLALAASPFACASQPEEETSCGPGTALANGQCIPVAQCGAGTALVNGTCVPVSGQGGASGTGAAGEGGGGSGATGGTSAAGGGQGGSQSGGSAGSAGESGASGSAQAGASGSQSSGGASGEGGAGGSGGASGSGLVDAPCPDKAPAFNCSDTCGPKSEGCDMETCNACPTGALPLELKDVSAFPAVIRTKSVAGVEAGCSKTCTAGVPGYESARHAMRVYVSAGLNNKTPLWYRVTMQPTDAWLAHANSTSDECCLGPYASSSCVVHKDMFPFVVQFLATKDDAPAQNALIEMSNLELTCP